MQELQFNGNVYFTENINDVILICFVDIEALCRQLLINVNLDNLKVKNIPFTHDNFKQELLCDDELTRLNSFKILKKQVEWIAGRFSIKFLAKNHFLSNLNYSDIELAYLEEGAPYIKGNNELAISITHSYDYAMGGIALKKGIRFGIDLEKMRYIKEENIPSFFNIAFSTKEREFLKDSTIETVYKNWTLKEAFLKYIQRGFHEPIHNIEIFDDALYFKGKHLNNLTSITKNITTDYIFSVVYD